MKKKSILTSSVLLVSAISLMGCRKVNPHPVDKDIVYSIFDASSALSYIDLGLQRQATILEGYKINFIGFDDVDEKMGKISSKTYGEKPNAVTYKGMIYNRSAITDLKYLSITYTGSPIHYTLSKYLMEDMSFVEDDSNIIKSHKDFKINGDYNYFVLYTSGEAIIDNFIIGYKQKTDKKIEYVFDANSNMINARSAPSECNLEGSYVRLQNNPTANNNNYSTGTYNGNAKTWYRWNGKAFKNSANLGTSFELHTTIVGNISQVIDPNNYFNYSVWPEFHLEGEEENNWDYVYIGNDNYEPLGKDSPDRVHTDVYGDYSYAGRFFTTYVDYGNNNWQFADPDQFHVVGDENTTLREAYNTYTLPFWYVVFKIYLEGSSIYCETYINGFHITTSELFDNYLSGELSINSYHMHCVNYGNPDQSPKDAYEGTFTYPRV